MPRANEDIRQTAQEAKVRFWQVAEVLRLSDGTFSRKLRHELPQAEKDRILTIIEQLRAEPEAV
jgi:hypothetical protein